jgi:hypothetical protein
MVILRHIKNLGGEPTFADIATLVLVRFGIFPRCSSSWSTYWFSYAHALQDLASLAFFSPHVTSSLAAPFAGHLINLLMHMHYRILPCWHASYYSRLRVSPQVWHETYPNMMLLFMLAAQADALL